MESEKFIPLLIGTVVGRYPMEVASLLNDSSVTTNAQDFNTDELIQAVSNGLVNNVRFNQEFVLYVNKNIDKIEPYLSV